MNYASSPPEEFEVHGPRLNRYAVNWAFYLGYHYAYRREPGEPQLTFNYCRALVDFLINFCYGRGVTFQSAKEYSHIVPALLNRVWEMDNNKQQIIREIAQQGGVSGDMFVKVAYDPAWTDPAGNYHPGRVRILPLNSAYVFPEWHPHDRERMIRCKIKYKFWSTTLEGTRSVFTYTEILTDDTIEEYLNDDLIDRRPNPLGTIPIAHAPNISVSGSPWGLADIHDLIPLNRQYNETATEIADIINYHAAPVTIITGAKASNLEKGPRKVWGGLPKDAQVYNLENGVDLTGPLAFLQLLKRAMHELAGVPETALGQVQPISNTSGVALSIEWPSWSGTEAQKDAEVDAFNQVIASVVAEFDAMVQLVDIDAAIAKNPKYLWDGLHPNELGNARIADACLDAIRCLSPPQSGHGVTASFNPPANRPGPVRRPRRNATWYAPEFRAKGTDYTPVTGDLWAVPFMVTEGRERFVTAGVRVAQGGTQSGSIQTSLASELEEKEVQIEPPTTGVGGSIWHSSRFDLNRPSAGDLVPPVVWFAYVSFPSGNTRKHLRPSVLYYIDEQAAKAWCERKVESIARKLGDSSDRWRIIAHVEAVPRDKGVGEVFYNAFYGAVGPGLQWTAIGHHPSDMFASGGVRQ